MCPASPKGTFFFLFQKPFRVQCVCVTYSITEGRNCRIWHQRCSVSRGHKANFNRTLLAITASNNHPGSQGENGMAFRVQSHKTTKANLRSDPDEHLGTVLGIWTPAIFSKRAQVPILECLLYIKKGAFLRLKRRGPKNFLGAPPLASVSPSLPLKDIAMRFIELQE